MKSVLISIQPKWCDQIALGKKTVEVRKTKPKLDVPFKVYIYQTKKPVSVSFSGTGRHISEYEKTSYYTNRSGKVIGEFVCDAVEHYTSNCTVFESVLLPSPSELEEMCLTLEEFNCYGTRDKLLYGWHIDNLVIYDKPKELSEFYTECKMDCEHCEMWGYTRVNADEFDMDCKSDWFNHKPLKRPPRSWCYIEHMDEKGR